ncbi:MAG: purine-binding chemotaxis protein CheW [Thiotrichaceae bacterium]|nr:purine-binding chemotaxis protein CheW [Thiotrichaceae bacterium]
MSELMVDEGVPSRVVLPQDGDDVVDVTRELDKYLTFRVGESNFGIDLLRIKEIIEYASVCDIPMVPSHIRGVINLRGNVVPVIDLAQRIGVEGDATESKRSCIIIIDVLVQDESMDIGLVVDAVNKVYEIGEEDVEHAPAFGANIPTEFIKGMGRIERKFVVLLELAKVLDIDEISIQEYSDLAEHS